MRFLTIALFAVLALFLFNFDSESACGGRGRARGRFMERRSERTHFGFFRGVRMRGMRGGCGAGGCS